MINQFNHAYWEIIDVQTIIVMSISYQAWGKHLSTCAYKDFKHLF